MVILINFMNIYLPRRNRDIIRHKAVSYSKVRSSFNLGFFAIESCQFGVVTPKQLEAGRKFIVRNLSRRAKLWRFTSVTQPLTKKSKLSRMGKGKGKFLGWLGYVKPGSFMYEMGYFAKKKNSTISSEKFQKSEVWYS